MAIDYFYFRIYLWQKPVIKYECHKCKFPYIYSVIISLLFFPFFLVFVPPKHLTTKLTWDHMSSRTQYFPTQVNKPLWIFCWFICLFLLISWSDKLAEYDRPGERELLSTVTEVSTTCAVVVFRVKVSCITSVDGISDYIHPDDHTQPTYEMTPSYSWVQTFHSLNC